MPNASQFYVEPASPLRGLSDVIGRGFEAEGEQRRGDLAKKELRDKLQKAADLIKTSDHQGLVQFMVLNPDLQEHLQSVQEDSSEAEKIGRIQTYREALTSGNPKQVVEKQIELTRQEGGDTADLERMLELEDDEIKDAMLAGLAIEQPQAAKAYMDATGYQKPLTELQVLDKQKKELDIKKLEREMETDLMQLSSGELPAEDRIKIEEKLRKEIFARSIEFEKVDDAYTRIKSSAKNPSAAGDLALIFNYMKMLDPGSTVREGEFATAEKAAGVPDRIINLYNKAIAGEKLGTRQRKDFVDRSKQLYDGAKKKNDEIQAKYKMLAKRYNVDPVNVVLTIDAAAQSGGFDLDAAKKRLDQLKAKMAPPP